MGEKKEEKEGSELATEKINELNCLLIEKGLVSELKKSAKRQRVSKRINEKI